MVTGQERKVETAFALGWHVAELRHARDEPGPPAMPAICLDQIQQFGLRQRVEVLVRQIRNGLASLGLLALDGDGANESIASFWCLWPLPLTEETPPADVRAKLDDVAEAHVGLLTALTAEDFRLGKAYALGVELSETVLLTYATLVRGTLDDDTRALWEEKRIQILVQQLGDLNSAFVDHAATVTAATLSDWSKTSQAWFETEDLVKLANERLYPQGAAWRAILSGEKLPTDYITVSENMRAIRNLLRDYGAVGWACLRSALWLWLVVLAALALLGVIAFVTYQFKAQVQAVYASLIGLLGVFGVTVATVVSAVKKALSTAEDRLWQAERAAAVAIALDWTPVRSKRSHVARLGASKVADKRPELT